MPRDAGDVWTLRGPSAGFAIRRRIADGWVAKKDISPASIESGLAWQLSTQNPEGWIEKPYYGTLGDQQFSVRVFAPSDR